MPLTPIEVQQKTFATALRGYDLDEVDDFLDQVVTSLNDYEQRLSDAKDRIAALESEVANKGDDESAISRALVTAQRSADKLVADAEADAGRMRADAESDAARIRDQANAEAARLSEEMRAQTEALEIEKRAQRSRLEAEIAAMSRGVGELRERVRTLVREIEGNVGEMEDAITAATPTSGTAGAASTATIPGPGPVPADPLPMGEADDATAHDQLDVGRIDTDDEIPAEGVPPAPRSLLDPDPDDDPHDPVHRAEEQLVAEMSADVDDLSDDETEEPDPVAEILDDGEFERVRRPWESD